MKKRRSSFGIFGLPIAVLVIVGILVVGGATAAGIVLSEKNKASKSSAEIIVDIVGCMDPAASNFNPAATVDSRNCNIEVIGCNNRAATNFDPNVTKHDPNLCEFAPIVNNNGSSELPLSEIYCPQTRSLSCGGSCDIDFHTDPKNCGSCGTDCTVLVGEGARCFNQQCREASVDIVEELDCPGADLETIDPFTPKLQRELASGGSGTCADNLKDSSGNEYKCIRQLSYMSDDGVLEEGGNNYWPSCETDCDCFRKLISDPTPNFPQGRPIPSVCSTDFKACVPSCVSNNDCRNALRNNQFSTIYPQGNITGFRGGYGEGGRLTDKLTEKPLDRRNAAGDLWLGSEGDLSNTFPLYVPRPTGSSRREGPPFSSGQLVNAKTKPDSNYYKAKILGVNTDGTYDVEFVGRQLVKRIEDKFATEYNFPQSASDPVNIVSLSPSERICEELLDNVGNKITIEQTQEEGGELVSVSGQQGGIFGRTLSEGSVVSLPSPSLISSNENTPVGFQGAPVLENRPWWSNECLPMDIDVVQNGFSRAGVPENEIVADETAVPWGANSCLNSSNYDRWPIIPVPSGEFGVRYTTSKLPTNTAILINNASEENKNSLTTQHIGQHSDPLRGECVVGNWRVQKGLGDFSS